MPEKCRVGLERNGQPAAQLSDHGSGGERRQAADLAAEMGLIGIARRQRQRRQLRSGRPSGEVEKALETEDAVQPLRAVAEASWQRRRRLRSLSSSRSRSRAWWRWLRRRRGRATGIPTPCRGADRCWAPGPPGRTAAAPGWPPAGHRWRCRGEPPCPPSPQRAELDLVPDDRRHRQAGHGTAAPGWNRSPITVVPGGSAGRAARHPAPPRTGRHRAREDRRSHRARRPSEARDRWASCAARRSGSAAAAARPC